MGKTAAGRFSCFIGCIFIDWSLLQRLISQRIF
ncbi:hypothetical protein CJA_1275 [Cellvibrio japonicus Ueda107]|uniref:Uncharacterized protein n=1 Tax=Cellvibrio japonicus (strain Ueda107) TaxID=498211 RepID=B3PCF9_CELJU|nr:hypothetical protein CJA_1275 [Cellvibrio japonicus Ueda107]